MGHLPRVSPEVAAALQAGQPVVALESTIITHGLPWPANLDLAIELEELVRAGAATPATIAVVAGELKVGLTRDELAELARRGVSCLKLSSYDLPWALAKGLWGSTTVAGTIYAAEAVGIKVFATGGIGGVHRGWQTLPDISHDLAMLAEASMVVVSAGAKAILDLPATVEYLETRGILTLGYRCSEFPAFYYRDSGIPLSYRVEELAEVAQVFAAMERRGCLLLANPVPAADALPQALVEACIDQALSAAQGRGIGGKELTPFLLGALAEATAGQTVQCNLSLVRNNASIATSLAQHIRSGLAAAE